MAGKQTNVLEHEHPIQVVARRTGLTADVIRVWERRYGVVTPERASNSRRLYSDSDVEKLIMLRRATSAGRRIGDVASLPLNKLRELVDKDESAAARLPLRKIEQRPSTGSVMEYFDDCLDAVQRFNSYDIYHSLSDASKSLGIIYRLGAYLDRKSLINMYYAFIQPYFHYCNEVWGNAYPTHLNRLVVLQKRAVRILSNSEYLAHTLCFLISIKFMKLP